MFTYYSSITKKPSLRPTEIVFLTGKQVALSSNDECEGFIDVGEVFGEVGLGGKFPPKSEVGMVREVVSPLSGSENIKHIVDFLLGLDEIWSSSPSWVGFAWRTGCYLKLFIHRTQRTSWHHKSSLSHNSILFRLTVALFCILHLPYWKYTLMPAIYDFCFLLAHGSVSLVSCKQPALAKIQIVQTYSFYVLRMGLILKTPS